MDYSAKLWVDLSDEEIGMLETLRREMGIDSVDEVMHSLIQQAYTRAIITCPACGHAAQRTGEDEARCDGCMSVLHLSDEIWRVIVSRPPGD